MALAKMTADEARTFEAGERVSSIVRVMNWPKYAIVTDGNWRERGEYLYEGDDIEAANAAGLAWPGRCTLVHFGRMCRNVRDYRAGKGVREYVYA